jgi:hypothetical protein
MSRRQKVTLIVVGVVVGAILGALALSAIFTSPANPVPPTPSVTPVGVPTQRSLSPTEVSSPVSNHDCTPRSWWESHIMKKHPVEKSDETLAGIALQYNMNILLLRWLNHFPQDYHSQLGECLWV